MPDLLSGERALIRRLVGDQAAAWDVAGEIPVDVLREAGASGALCAQVPRQNGGLGAGSLDNGEFTAYVGSLCSSLRSVMTSQGMAAHTVRRLGTREQRAAFLPELTGGRLAAVAFSEPDAGSDLSRMGTTIGFSDGEVVINGCKSWITAAAYADLLLVFGKAGDGGAVAVVPADTPGVVVEKVPRPLGCRAAGHAGLRLEDVRVPAANVLGGGGLSLSLLITAVLTYGRVSVAWGCVGILRACLAAVTDHARSRVQFGKPIAEHQLIQRRIAELFAAEQVAAAVCRQASECWESGSPELVVTAVLAKYVSSARAVAGAASAVHVLAAAGAQDGQVVARAHRDAILMETIEGSTEISQLILAQRALAAAGR